MADRKIMEQYFRKHGGGNLPPSDQKKRIAELLMRGAGDPAVSAPRGNFGPYGGDIDPSTMGDAAYSFMPGGDTRRFDYSDGAHRTDMELETLESMLLQKAANGDGQAKADLAKLYRGGYLSGPGAGMPTYDANRPLDDPNMQNFYVNEERSYNNMRPPAERNRGKWHK